MLTTSPTKRRTHPPVKGWTPQGSARLLWGVLSLAFVVLTQSNGDDVWINPAQVSSVVTTRNTILDGLSEVRMRNGDSWIVQGRAKDISFELLDPDAQRSRGAEFRAR